MALIHDDFKETVRARTDIVALIGEFVALRPASGGREFIGLCPFHDDHNPSMRVYPQRQSFRCWVCQAGGDCYSFLMKHEKFGFRDALEFLAKRANLPMPERFRKPQDEGGADKGSLYEVLAWAEQQFHECLLRDPLAEHARAYLREERRLSPATIEQFKLGYHPKNWQWLLSRAARKFSVEQLSAAWLAKPSDRGDYHDMPLFLDRVLFPIRDTQGRTVSFGGRILPGTDHVGGKYFNGGDTSVFHKSELLYGLDQARIGIRDSKSAVVVEGYMDTIACHQAGVRNAIAGLGTALGESHARLLKRFTQTVILLLDGDDAGQLATDRTLPFFLSQGVDLRVLALPEKLDPDEYIAAHGVEALQAALNSAADAWDHKLHTSVTRHGLETVIGRQRVLDEMLGVLSDLRDTPGTSGSDWTLRESIMFTRLVQQLGVKETDLRKQLAQMRARKAQPPGKGGTVPAESKASPARPADVFPTNPTADDLAERDLLCLILAAPDRWGTLCEVLTSAEFRNRNLARLYEVCLDVADNGGPPTYERVTLATDDPDLTRLAAYLAERADMVPATPELVEHTLNFFRQRRELTEGSMPLKGHHLSTPSDALGSDALERLRHATLLHQKRAGKPT